MLGSVLLHFSSPQLGETVIELGVHWARRSGAKVRGLTVVDTRPLAALLARETACYAKYELDRLHGMESAQDHAGSLLSQACLSAGLDFDVRRLRGNPLEILPPESQFHDLVVTSLPGPGELEAGYACLSAADLVELLYQGVDPLLVVRSPNQPIRRVLLVGDGTAASAHAIRQFVQQFALPDVELRLLAIGPSEERARASLREMADYCSGRGLVFESGWLRGTARRSTVPYARKWGADLVVLGVQRAGRVVRRFWGEPAEQILQKTGLALYAATK